MGRVIGQNDWKLISPPLLLPPSIGGETTNVHSRRPAVLLLEPETVFLPPRLPFWISATVNRECLLLHRQKPRQWPIVVYGLKMPSDRRRFSVVAYFRSRTLRDRREITSSNVFQRTSKRQYSPPGVRVER